MRQATLLLLPLLASLQLAGCSSAPERQIPPSVASTPALPQGWLAPLPHQGSSAGLSQWWQQFQDPLLLQLIERAQAASPTLQAAVARLDEARAVTRQAAARLGPSLDAQLQSQRGRFSLNQPTSTQSTAQLNAGWEIDLFGAARADRAAARQQAEAAGSQWHAARVSLAADVASAYLSLRHAQAQEEIAEIDIRAALALAQWGEQQRRAGLISLSDAALLNTQLAAVRAFGAEQRAQAQIAVLSLAQLCAQTPSELAPLLAAPPLAERPHRAVPKAPPFAVQALPPEVLAQRPDLVAAHQQWLAAASSEQAARMQERPQLSLGALLGRQSLRLGGTETRGTIWQLAPSLSLPLLNGGNLAAQTSAATARTAQAAAAFEQRWREVLTEVETALQRLQAADQRRTEMDRAAQDWQRIALDAERLAAAGVQSGPQRVNTQRNALAALSVLLAVHQEQAQAWVSLYRSLGGGWTPADSTPPSTTS